MICGSIEVASISKPVIWDLGGQRQYLDEYHTSLKEGIFQKAAILLYVIDVSDINRYESSKAEFEWAAKEIISYNPNAKINVFLHKIDLIHDKDAVVQHIKDLLSKNVKQAIGRAKDDSSGI